MISRRQLVRLAGRAGGVTAAWHTMAAMGLLPVAAYAGPPALPRGGGARVLILGAGIAGMVAAYELGRAGYDCAVLEARARAGGRNWSLRGGDVVHETDSTQRVAWERADHLWFNPGPARLPCQHAGILSYCRALDVPLEVMINDNRGALMQDEAVNDGRPFRNRAVINDGRGYVAELAAKAVGAPDHPVDAGDLERLRAYLIAFGALDADLTYRGSSRSGWDTPPGGGEDAGTHAAPIALETLLRADFWRFDTQFGEEAEQAATMMQPVGGMGRIGEAFGRALGRRITYGATVTAIRRAGSGARVEWTATDGARHADAAAHVICTIPFPVLRDIPADLAPATRAAMAAVEYIPAGKAAFQATRRFWETDDAIYGGISWTSRDSTQVWYPSVGIHAARGILVGAYVWAEDTGRRFAAKSPAQRLADTLADVERLHAGCRRDLEAGVTVSWAKMPHSRGAWAEWSAAARRDAYPVLLAGDGPVTFAGEHMSYVPGWQEGAVRSAHHAIAGIGARVAQDRA